ncbi:MAG: PfkB family carbohydrate kinase [Acidobacteriota bacterium]
MSGTRRRWLDAFGLGLAVRDLTVRLDPVPAADEKVTARGFAESGGGPVPTALVTLARLGRRCAFAGVVGTDDAGAFIEQDLRREAIDTSCLLRRDDAGSATSVILVEPGGARRVCEWGQKDLPFSAGDLRSALPLLDDCEFLLIDARLPEAQREAAARVRRRGGRVVLDCGHPRPGVEPLLQVTDVAIFSHSYPRSLHGERFDAERFVGWLRERLAPGGPRIAGLTLGRAGCLIARPGGAVTRVPGLPVHAVDTTGAGDVFHGAFVHRLLDGASATDAARFANAAAALSCRQLTARAPLPDAAAIRRFAATGRA